MTFHSSNQAGTTREMREPMSDLEKQIQQKLSADGKELLPDGAEDRLLAAVLAANRVEEPSEESAPDSPYSWSYNLAAVASLMAVFALGLLVTNYTPGTISIGPSTGTTEVQTDSAEGSTSEDDPSTDASGDLTSPANQLDSDNEGRGSGNSSSGRGSSSTGGGSSSHSHPDGSQGPADVEEFVPGLLRSPSTSTGDSNGTGPAGAGSSNDADVTTPAEDIPVEEDPEPGDPQVPVDPPIDPIEPTE